MKRLTTDSPKDNVSTTLNLFYIKDRETWIRGGGQAPEYKDVTLDDFMRRQIKERLPEIKAPESWREFSCMMAEWLMDAPESETGLLATLYAAAWGFAEIRERLKRYEDTGAMPDVLEELLKGLTRIEKLGGWDLVDRWVKAASEGRLVEMPCKFGDPIYRIRRFKRGKNWSKEAEHIMSATLTMNNVANVLFGDVMGKTVFLTREEATAALKGEDHGEQV